MTSDSALLVAALTGGLGGAVFTIFVQGVWAWIRRPVLKVDFDPSIRGCEVRTPTNAKTREILETIGGPLQRYLRLRVHNKGQLAAKDVRASILRIRHTASNGDATVFDDEVLDLIVSLVGGISIQNLPRDAYRFFDLFHIETSLNGAASSFDISHAPLRLLELKLGIGRYEADVFLSAENAKPIRSSVSWNWGDPDDLHIQV